MLLLVDNTFLKATEIEADEYIFLERGVNIQITEISDREYMLLMVMLTILMASTAILHYGNFRFFSVKYLLERVKHNILNLFRRENRASQFF